MAVNLSPIWGAGAQLLDNSGNVLSGGKIYTYAAGTTTQVATYTSNTGLTANSNPIVLNSAGRVPYEIWLLDGQIYKFVLKDSNDVLIGTWDNLIGINSNFIAYTNQQEIQTATAGQTVFNLTTMNYLVGTNSLSVFVDGVNQYGPGAQYAFEETDDTTVTFASGLHVGAEVKFTSTQLQGAGAVDASQVSYTPPFTNSAPTNVEDKLAQTISVKDFGAVADGSDETTKVQYAIDALPTAGGIVYINPGIKFYLTDLTFPPKCNLQYYVDSDLSNPGSFGDIASNELVYFSANSSYPADPSGAEVNEWRYTAPFHPGVVVDVRKDVTGADAWFRPGQNRLDPARASYNIMDEQTQVWSNLYQTYETNSKFSGVYTGGTLNKISLNGIGTAAWPTVPSVGNAVYGTTSGAQGFVVSVGASETIVRWFKGRFVAGETVLWIAPGPSTVTSTATIISTTLITTPFPSLTQDLNKGVWAIGLPPNVPEESFTAGGRIVSTNTRTSGQYVYKTVTEPGYGFIDSYEAVTPKGRWIVAESATDFKRVVLRAIDATTDIGQVGACNAHTGFSNAGLTSSRFNITSFVRNGTGDYTFTFTSPLANDYYSVLITAASPTNYGYVYARTTTTVQVKVVTTGTSTPVDATGIMSMAIFGGDI